MLLWQVVEKKKNNFLK